MGGMSLWHILLVLIVVFILFGAGKLPKVMGDVGKGIRNMRDGLKSEDDTSIPPQNMQPPIITPQVMPPVNKDTTTPNA